MPAKCITPEVRSQYKLVSLDSLIPEKSEVRVIDVLAEQFWQTWSKDHPQILNNTHAGAPAYPYKELLKLLVYGYRNKIASSRKLEAATHINIEVIFLLGELHPSYRTIAAFRAEQSELIQSFFDFVRDYLLQQISEKRANSEGLIIAIDGTKFKAYASLTTVQCYSQELRKTKLELESYLKEAEELDHLDELEEENLQLKERIEQLKLKIEEKEEKVKACEAKLAAAKTVGEQRFVNDPDARCMKHKSGAFDASYNTQLAVESSQHIILDYAVSNNANDIHQLEPVARATCDATEKHGLNVDTFIADSGYCNAKQIQSLEADGHKCIVGIPKVHQKESDAKNDLSFEYDAKNDVVHCSNNALLKFKRNRIHRGTVYKVYQASYKDCSTCPFRDKCTSSKHGRSIWLSEDHDWKETRKLEMEKPENKAALQKRMGMIENINGTIKCWMGKHQLLLASLKKVKTEIALYCASFNIVRLCHLTG